MLRLARSFSSRYVQQARFIHRASVCQADPYPIPLQSHQPSAQNDSEATAEEDLPQEFLPKPLSRPNEDLATIRARLVYQSRKRGMLEGDLLLSTFAKENLGQMSMEELKEFDQVRVNVCVHHHV